MAHGVLHNIRWELLVLKVFSLKLTFRLKSLILRVLLFHKEFRGLVKVEVIDLVFLQPFLEIPRVLGHNTLQVLLLHLLS